MQFDLLSGLNPPQGLAVQATEGPVLVLAGPGSGKTRVLTHRIAYLIHQQGIDPLQILAVTFTNKAAREMGERLDALIGGSAAQSIAVGTFHKLCARWLRRDIQHLGREQDFAIYDGDDQERLMKLIIRELALDEKKHPARAILGRISSAKNELVGPAEFAKHVRDPFDVAVQRCYEQYQIKLRESNALDFDDLLIETVRLFQNHPQVLERYQDRYRYLLVDEYQDTNRPQYLIVKLLAAKRRNLFAVGDEDQSVYGWRGADIRNIRSFESDYPEAKVILLEQNYRSTQAILDVAQAVVRGDARRKHDKRLWTENGSGMQVSLHECFDQSEEARWVAEEINRLVTTNNLRYRDCAVMYRTNAQSRAIEEGLMARNVPYYVVGGVRFYDRKEIRDVLSYLRLAHNPHDLVSLSRVINVPGRGIGERSENDLLIWARTLGMTPIDALRELRDPQIKSPFRPNIRNALLNFLGLIDDLQAVRTTRPLPDFFDYVLERSKYREYIRHEYTLEEAADRLANVDELRNATAEYINLAVETQLAVFLEEVALVADVDSIDGEQDVITCMTLHQAKGLEFAAVFLVGLEEGLLPHFRSVDDRERLEEERRLLYVGITRAKQRLAMLYTSRRTTFGRTNLSTPSRFLADIPKDMVKNPLLRPRAQASAPQTSMFTARSMINPPPSSRGPRPSRSDSPPPPVNRDIKFRAGMQVRHGHFGEGIVLSSKLIDGDEEILVRFTDRERRLLASLARLEVLE